MCDNGRPMSSDLQPRRQNSTSLVDVLDRVLDKGLVVAGDIKVSVAEVELLTIRVRLVVCSIDKAQEIGLDWWRRDPYLSGRFDRALPDAAPSEGERLLEPEGFGTKAVEAQLVEENRRLRAELKSLRERAPVKESASPRRKAADTTTSVAKNKPMKGVAKPRPRSSAGVTRRKSRKDSVT